MLQILLHSSKTMAVSDRHSPLATPIFLKEAGNLVRIFQELSIVELAKLMRISSAKAAEVKKLYAAWSALQESQSPAIDAFKGDIYSGLQVVSWSEADRTYAQEHLVILSGLYGALKACDGIMPYRLEMAYKLPDGESLYSFWGNRLTRVIDPKTTCVVNLSAVEYTKALLPHVDKPVITPKFMTVDPRTGEPAFVVVHAKIARGAFARWLIQERIEDSGDITAFADLGYIYDAHLSTPEQPVFVCKAFQGIGLSVRIKKE